MNARYHLGTSNTGTRTGSRTRAGNTDPLILAGGNSSDIRPEMDVELDAQEGFVEGYYSDTMSPLEDAIGCSGVSVLDATSDEAIDEYDDLVLGFQDEDPVNRALAMIATTIMQEIDRNAESTDSESCDDEDVGMIVLVKNTDSQDFGTMVYYMTTASTPEELEGILFEYESMPGAKELAKACAEKMAAKNPALKGEVLLRLVS